MPKRGHRRGPSPDEEYQYFMGLAKQDPEAAATEFLQRLRKKPTKDTIHTIHQLERILQGDQSAWQAGSRDMTQAVQFLISNSLMKKMGFSPKFEGRIVNLVADMISEDVDFMPMTPVQRRMKAIAESYGFIVVQLR
jgi:hypothetical protein